MNSENRLFPSDQAPATTEADSQGAKLCIDVIANLWSKEHASDPSTYKQNYATWLGKQNASPLELDMAWEKNMIAVGTKEKGADEAVRTMNQFKNAEKCI